MVHLKLVGSFGVSAKIKKVCYKFVTIKSNIAPLFTDLVTEQLELLHIQYCVFEILFQDCKPGMDHKKMYMKAQQAQKVDST